MAKQGGETKSSAVGQVGQVGWVMAYQERLRLARPEMMALVRDVSGWKIARHDAKKSKAVIESRDGSRPENGKMVKYKLWRCRIDLPASMDTVEHWIIDPEKVKKWNPVLINANKVVQVDKNIDILRYAFQPFAGGLISSREFVTLRRKEPLATTTTTATTGGAGGDGRLFLAVGCEHSSAPVNKDRVRGWTGPSGFVLEPIPSHSNHCRMTWVLNSDSKLPPSIPQKLVDSAFVKLLVSLMRNLRDALHHKK